MMTQPKPLSPREREVLCRVREGRKDKQIARDLRIQTQTVHNHLKLVYAKLGVKSRTMAVLTAINIGEIDLDDDTKGGDNVNPDVKALMNQGVTVGGRAGTAVKTLPESAPTRHNYN